MNIIMNNWSRMCSGYSEPSSSYQSRVEPEQLLTLYITNDKPGEPAVIIKTNHQPTDRETNGYDQVARLNRDNVFVWILLKGEPLPLPELQSLAVIAVDQPGMWTNWDLTQLGIKS